MIDLTSSKDGRPQISPKRSLAAFDSPKDLSGNAVMKRDE